MKTTCRKRIAAANERASEQVTTIPLDAASDQRQMHRLPFSFYCTTTTTVHENDFPFLATPSLSRPCYSWPVRVARPFIHSSSLPNRSRKRRRSVGGAKTATSSYTSRRSLLSLSEFIRLWCPINFPTQATSVSSVLAADSFLVFCCPHSPVATDDATTTTATT